MEPRQFASRLQARRLSDLTAKLRDYPQDRLEALEIMLKTTERRWLSTDEVADELMVDIETVRRWIRTRQLRAYRAGRKYRVDPDDLKRFLGMTPDPDPRP